MSWLLFTLLGLLWGGSYIAIKPLVHSFPPIFAATCRVTLALVFFVILYSLTGRSFTVRSDRVWKVRLVGVFLMGIPFSLLFWGQQYVTPGLAGVLTSTVPLFVFIFGFWFLRGVEVFQLRKLVGLIVGLIGTAMIFYPRIHIKGSFEELMGAFAVLGMAASYAVAAVANRVFFTNTNKPVDLYGCLFQEHLSAAVTLGLISLVVEGILSPAQMHFNATTVGSLVYLSFCSNVVAWMIYFGLLKQWGAIKTSLVSYLIPPVSLLFDYWIFGQRPETWELAGSAVILAGIFIIQYDQYAQTMSYAESPS